MMGALYNLSRCYPCHGKGYVTDVNIPMAIFTCGLTALVDTALDCKKRCPRCRGLGFTYSPSPRRLKQ